MNPSDTPPSTASLMTGTSQRKAHTVPGAQRARLNKRECTKVQAHSPNVCLQSHPCTTVPEEELSTIANTQRHPSQLPSLQLPEDSLNPMVPSFPPQTSTPLQQITVCHSHVTQTERCRLGNAHLSGASTPIVSRRSPTMSCSYARPSSNLSFGEEPQWQRGHVRHGSMTQDARTSLSTPASEMWSENLNPDTTEELSFAHSELEDCEEHSWPQNLPSDHNSHYGGSVNYPCFQGRNHGYPHNGDIGLASSNSITMDRHGGKFPHPAHSSCSLPTLLHSRYHSQGDFKQQCHMSTRYHNKQQG